jgi:Cof subfamily protein (haloacid dehalogenase superfamily)
MAQASEAENFPCVFVDEYHLHVCQPNPEVEEIFQGILKVDAIPRADVSTVVQRDIYQMSPFITPRTQHRLMPMFDGCESNRWHHSFTDITARGNNKQHGIRHVIRHFGIRPDEVMAVGDGGNDVGMLRFAAIGVAMGGARDEVKAAANYVTSDVDDDGVARALQHYGIG